MELEYVECTLSGGIQIFVSYLALLLLVNLALNNRSRLTDTMVDQLQLLSEMICTD